jgi:GNAT superfamily N-acetyltransferase
VTAPAKPGVTIMAFDATRHDRTAFSCGVAQIDNYFRKTANKLVKAGNLRVFVMSRDADDAMIGFYAVNAHAVDYQDLPDTFARTRPGHGQIPAAYIAMIAVDQRCVGQGFGGDLLVDALLRIARVADSLGLAIVMLDVFDCGNPTVVARRQALYASYGFQPLPSRPQRMFLPIATIRALFATR